MPSGGGQGTFVQHMDQIASQQTQGVISQRREHTRPKCSSIDDQGATYGLR